MTQSRRDKALGTYIISELPSELRQKFDQWRTLTGGILGPMEAWLALRSLATETREARNFVEEFTLSDGRPFDPKLLENNGAVAGRVLLEQLHVNVGDKIKLGDGEFQIRATFDEEPGTGGGRLAACESSSSAPAAGSTPWPAH